MAATPPPEVISAARDTLEYARQLETSPAFRWFTDRLVSMRRGTIEALGNLQPIEETRYLQARLSLLSEFVNDDGVCHWLGRQVQGAKQVLPKE